MSKTYPSFKIVFKEYTRKDGTKNLFLRLTINRKVRYFPLNIYVNPDHFKSGSISRSDPDHENKNTLVDHYFIKAKKILFDYRIQDKSLTFGRFIQDFQNNFYGSNSFYDFYQDQMERLKNKLSYNTIKAYSSQLNKLKEFRKDLTFNDIDKEFILEYEGFLNSKKSNNRNTINKSLRYIKAILNIAVEQQIIEKNPLEKYKMKSTKSKKIYLVQKEVEILNNQLYNGKLNSKQYKVLNYFLFSCYTGLRPSDVKNLKYSNIQNTYDNEGNKIQIINIQMKKTEETLTIKLIDEATQLINNTDTKNHFKNQKVFKVYEGSRSNIHLKEVLKSVGIEKDVKWRNARHSFATIGVMNNIPVVIISKLLGHSNIKTTMAYIDVPEEIKYKAMDKYSSYKQS